jgi:hypothetical protein
VIWLLFDAHISFLVANKYSETFKTACLKPHLSTTLPVALTAELSVTVMQTALAFCQTV